MEAQKHTSNIFLKSSRAFFCFIRFSSASCFFLWFKYWKEKRVMMSSFYQYVMYSSTKNRGSMPPTVQIRDNSKNRISASCATKRDEEKNLVGMYNMKEIVPCNLLSLTDALIYPYYIVIWYKFSFLKKHLDKWEVLDWSEEIMGIVGIKGKPFKPK